MAEKNSEQTNRQTDRQTNRHYENNGHLAVNQKYAMHAPQKPSLCTKFICGNTADGTVQQQPFETCWQWSVTLSVWW